MNTWKVGIFALFGLAVLACIGLNKEGSAHTVQTGPHVVIGCDGRDPLSSCVADPAFAYPIGDGLVVTFVEDFF
jgi:hypothetical protein